MFNQTTFKKNLGKKGKLRNNQIIVKKLEKEIFKPLEKENP